MANYPKKMQDPAESALSAIQEALGTVDKAPPGRPAASPEPIQPDNRRHGMSAASDKDLFDGAGPSSSGDEQPPARRAANDDRQSIGMILQTLQRRPPRTSYVVASVFALAWVVGGLIVAGLYLPDLQSVLTQGPAGIPAMIGLAAFVLAPVLFFYALAHMVWRSQELRLIAQSMAGVAMRLAEPEEVARESIVTVGQAIRREVAAMGDGVERALARAAELEALVANEVSALERAYHENEVRIRGLLEGLAHQRDTLVAQSEQVRNAISSVHLDLTNDIASVSDHVSHRVNESAQKIVHALTEKGEHITLALGRAGDFMIGALGERGGDLLERLERTSQETTEAIATASDRLTSSLNFKTDHITEEFSELTNNLSVMMETRLDDVTQGFAQKSSAIVQMMDERSQQITDAIVDTSSRLAETIVTRGDEVNNTLKSTGNSLVLDLSLRGGDVVSKLEQTGTSIAETITERGGNVSEAFRAHAETLASSVSGHSDAVRELLAARLQAFEQMFSSGGAELTEKISRDSTTLGNLITRHVAEFDRTVKTYGGELVERLGQRTQEVSDSMRTYVDGFDTKVGTKAAEVTATLDQRLSRFQEALDSRTQTLNEALSSRVMDIAKTLAEGGKEVVSALDKRIGDVTVTIDTRGAKLAETIGDKIGDIDQALGNRAMEVANTLDTRIGRFEQLLVGRAEHVTEQIEVRTKAAADVLNARMEQLASVIQTNSAEAERALAQASGNAERALTQASGDAERVLGQVAGNAEKVLGQASTTAERVVGHITGEVERSLSAVSTGISTVLKQNATDVERTLLGVSAEVARSFVGKADEISAQVSARANEMTKILDANSSTLLGALGVKSKEFTAEIGKATDQALKAIETQGFTFTRTMMDNSEQIARMVNEASESATSTVNLTLKSLQESTHAAIEQSKATASATVSEMLETHSMVRSDTTVLFERLREANILLQEVLSGAHENMSALENTLVTRVSEFVSTMNEVAERSGVATNQVDQHITSFHTATSKVLTDLSQLAGQFDQHGRSLAEAVALVDASNRRTNETFGERRAAIETIVGTLDERTADIEQRLKSFSSLLDETLEGASGRAREIARVIADSSAEGAQTMEQERTRTSEAMRTIFGQYSGETADMFTQTTQRFTDLLAGMKQMSTEMQRELESTRGELRRGILELPQETAESAAQMRRVIVDQIEALAELNRIVARHGRGMDAAEPARRGEPVAAVASSRMEAPRYAEPRMEPPRAEMHRPAPAPRPDITGNAPLPPRRAEAPSLSPAAPGQAGGDGRSGWLSELLHRASRPEEPVPEARAPRGEPRAAHHTIESLELALGRYRPDDRSRRRGRAVGPLQARRAQRVHTPALHHAGSEDLRRDPEEVSCRPRIQADGRPLRRRVRAAARRSLARRPRPGGGAHLPHLGDRQGLYDAGPRRRTVRRVRLRRYLGVQARYAWPTL